MARAAAILLDLDVSAHPEAAPLLNGIAAEGLEADEATLLMVLRREAEESVGVGRAVDAYVAADDASRDEHLALLSAHEDLALRHVIQRIGALTDEEAARGRALLDLARRLTPKGALDGVTWPEAGNGRAGSAVASSLSDVWRTLPPPEEIVRPFLKLR